MAEQQDMSQEDKPLTPKQERFCEEYIVDLNATQAAIRAGYSERSAREIASTMLTKHNVQRRVAELTKQRSNSVGITVEYVLSTIKETIERCRQAEPVMEFNRQTRQMEPTGEWKFEHQGVLKGTELLGRYLKLFVDKVEVTDTTGIAARLDRALKRKGKLEPK